MQMTYNWLYNFIFLYIYWVKILNEILGYNSNIYITNLHIMLMYINLKP
jgi:hypothetical protein